MAIYKRVETIEAWQWTGRNQSDANEFGERIGQDCTLIDWNRLSIKNGIVLHDNEYLAKRRGRYYRLSEQKFKELGYQIVLT